MRDVLDWLVDNRRWVFSGIGVLVVGGVVGLVKIAFTSLRTRDRAIEMRDSQPTSTTRAESQRSPVIWAGSRPIELHYDESSPLRLRRGERVTAEIDAVASVRSPVRYALASPEGPAPVLMPVINSKIRAAFDQLTLAQLRETRSEVEARLRRDLEPEFERVGMTLESLVFGRIERVSS